MSRFRPCLLLIALTAAWAQSPEPPTALTVKAATSKQVQLTWTAPSGAKTYTVQRKAEDGDFGVALPAVPDPAITDVTIDPYTTYTYRVVAVNDSGVSQPSNEVIVGPPLYGFNVIVPTPDLPDVFNYFGSLPRMALDSNGDPALAYVYQDPNGDGDEADDIIYFVSWNRVLYKWNDIVKVAQMGPSLMNRPVVPLSLARDADTNTWGLAYEVEDASGSRIDIAFSTDNGVTWTAVKIASDPFSHTYAEPSLALGGGNVYLSYSGAGLRYVTGKAADDPAKWSSQNVPIPGGYNTVFTTSSIALDSNGEPGIAFVAGSKSDSAGAFWRPAGSGGAVVIAGNGGNTQDSPDIALAFCGATPRVAMDVVRDDLYNSSYDHSIWAATASNSGGTWLTPVNVPSDGQTSLLGPLSITSGSQCQVAISMSTNGGVDNGVVCGYPKITRSADLLTFQTCGAAPKNTPCFSQVRWPVIKFGGNDKLWAVFQNVDSYGELGTGVVLWRER